MIENMVLKTSPTIVVSNGTDQTFAPDGTLVSRGICVSDVAGTDVRTRAQVIFKNTNGTLQPSGTWSKSRRSAKFVQPGLLPDGSQDFPFLEVTLVVSPLWGASVINNLKEKAAQLLIDTDTTNFFATGSLK